MVQFAILKNDRSFVKDIGFDKSDMGIIKAVISLANVLNLSTVAEGVESEEQLDFLKKEGIDFYQGFYFTKPMPLDELINFMKNYRN